MTPRNSAGPPCRGNWPGYGAPHSDPGPAGQARARSNPSESPRPSRSPGPTHSRSKPRSFFSPATPRIHFVQQHRSHAPAFRHFEFGRRFACPVVSRRFSSMTWLTAAPCKARCANCPGSQGVAAERRGCNRRTRSPDKSPYPDNRARPAVRPLHTDSGASTTRTTGRAARVRKPGKRDAKREPLARATAYRVTSFAISQCCTQPVGQGHAAAPHPYCWAVAAKRGQTSRADRATKTSVPASPIAAQPGASGSERPWFGRHRQQTPFPLGMPGQVVGQRGLCGKRAQQKAQQDCSQTMLSPSGRNTAMHNRPMARNSSGMRHANGRNARPASPAV